MQFYSNAMGVVFTLMSLIVFVGCPYSLQKLAIYEKVNVYSHLLIINTVKILMKKSDQTLLEQLKITQREIERRKKYLGFTDEDCQTLADSRSFVTANVDSIVDDFYKRILPFDEVDRLIGDAETLQRLKNHMRNYIVTLFDGQYDEEYIHSRLRVGVVHRRIGVDPKFYVSAVHIIISILREVVITHSEKSCDVCNARLTAIEKIIMFDLSLTFDTYIHSLMDEVVRSREELAKYAESLEEQVADRTKRLEVLARHDGLTGLLNQQAFYSELRRELLRGQRMNCSTVLIYFDLDGFKQVNDTHGHKRGDEILIAVAESMKTTLRSMDVVARYGGDEFCVVMPESSVEEAEQGCTRLCAEIEKSTAGSGVSCSLGIAVSTPVQQLDADTMVKMADAAMYEAKQEPGFVVKISK